MLGKTVCPTPEMWIFLRVWQFLVKGSISDSHLGLKNSHQGVMHNCVRHWIKNMHFPTRVWRFHTCDVKFFTTVISSGLEVCTFVGWSDYFTPLVWIFFTTVNRSRLEFSGCVLPSDSFTLGTWFFHNCDQL